MRWSGVLTEFRVYKSLYLSVYTDQHSSSIFPHPNRAVTRKESTFDCSLIGTVSLANPHVSLAMCQTSYKYFSKCRCLYIGEHPICCSKFASNHPESLGRPSFKPKLLTKTRRGLDMDLDGISFMSADVDNQRAPRGLTCPDIITFVQAEPAAEGCPLCQSPHVLAAVNKQQTKGQRVLAKSAGTYEWKPMQEPVRETASTESGSVPRKENHFEMDQVRKQPELLQITGMDEPATRRKAKSNKRPMQAKPQTSANRAVDRYSDRAELLGHRHNVSASSTSSGGHVWSTDSDMRADSPPYWNPLEDRIARKD